MKKHIIKNLFLVLFIGLSITSCASYLNPNAGKKTISSSLMDFLYPDKESHAVKTIAMPKLTLPVKVGIAFIPSKNKIKGITNKNEIELLAKVKTAFLQYDYIDRIEIIPSTYLSGGKGFTTLEQVSRLYDVDIIALVSYDQITQTLENKASLLYWTIAGMYLIPGNENIVQTFVDTAVFDIKSQKMLFRAPGISKVEKTSTLVDIDKVLTQNSIKGFELAVIDMTKNLNTELSRFKQRVKEEKIAKIERREGYSGGAFGYIFIPLLFSFMFRKLNSNKI
jgi:rhombotail lipoprotein